MISRTWKTSQGKAVVCLDSYQGGVPKGRIYSPYMDVETFDSMTQFLIKMESLLDEMQSPQSYTETRTFRTVSGSLDPRLPPSHFRKGTHATFEVHVLFRQHTSWQGVINWLDEQLEQSFRSVLELILLMDSALRAEKGCDSA